MEIPKSLVTNIANGEQYEQFTLGEPSEQRTVQTNRLFKIGERIQKSSKKHYRKIFSTVIGLAAIIAAVIEVKIIYFKNKCESKECIHGCFMVPERTYCSRDNETECFNKICINENDWTDYAGIKPVFLSYFSNHIHITDSTIN